jgi:hypothetical protein
MARFGGPFFAREFQPQSARSTSFTDAFDLLINFRVLGADCRIAGAIWTAGGDRAVDLPTARAACSIAGSSNRGRTSRSRSVT